MNFYITNEIIVDPDSGFGEEYFWDDFIKIKPYQPGEYVYNTGLSSDFCSVFLQIVFLGGRWNLLSVTKIFLPLLMFHWNQEDKSAKDMEQT